MKLRTTYNADADTAYVEFGDPRAVAETIPAAPDISIDLDEGGRIVGIELVTASRVLDSSALEDSAADEFIGVTEIAGLLGKRKQNIAQYYTRRADFPQPAAQLATGRYWRRGDVEDWFRKRTPNHGVDEAERTLAVARDEVRPETALRDWVSGLGHPEQTWGREISRATLDTWIVDALRDSGGNATLVEVCRHIWSHHGSELEEAGDIFFTWQYDVRWAAYRLRRRNVLRPAHDSPFGVWELLSQR